MRKKRDFNFDLQCPSSVMEEIEEKKEVPQKVEVLVVDDEEILGVLMTEALSSYNLKACYANNPSQALKLLEENPDRFSVLITDQTMPKMTGMELIQKVSSLYPKISAILCTGHSEEVSAKSVSEMGVTYFQKPVDIDSLVEMVHKLARN